MEAKEYSMSRKLVWAVIHQLFMILMVTCIFYLGTLRHTTVQLVSERGPRPETNSTSNMLIPESNSLGNALLIEEDPETSTSEVLVVTIASMVGLAGSLLVLAYLTQMSGRNDSKDSDIHMRPIDKLPSDVMMILLLLLFIGMLQIVYFLSSLAFETGGLLVTVGTLTYLIDIPFLFFYLSFVRRIKSQTLWTSCILYEIQKELKEISQERHWVIQYLLKHILGLIVAVACAILLISKHIYGLIVPIVVIILWDLYDQMRRATDQYKIREAIEQISSGKLETSLELSDFAGQEQEIAMALNHINEGMLAAVEDKIRNERMKADLITNVSHDIKTPLTSIVNYVDLLKREELRNEKAENYIRIIDEKANRLKSLTEDLVEASRISSGNIKLEMNRIDFVELLYQAGGEFNERFEARNLTIVTKLPQTSVFINADGRQLYRTVENLYTNASKYAMENTRVYVELHTENQQAVFTMKNVSAKPVVNEKGGPSDLTERFVRGEVSRTTEGSGLGLSIAKNLTNLMGGNFDISVDGDLFIVTIRFSLDL